MPGASPAQQMIFGDGYQKGIPASTLTLTSKPVSDISVICPEKLVPGAGFERTQRDDNILPA
jgi:hypothetical protein